MTRVWILIAAVALPGACGSGSPIMPTPILPTSVVSTVQSTAPPVASSASRVFRATVIDEDDRPVVGAAVRFDSQPPVIAVTDATGAFEMSVESSQSAGAFPLAVAVEKSGYEPSWGWVGSCCQRIRLYRIREMTAGDTVTLTLFNEAYCGDFLDYPCRRFRVRSSSKGLLTVQVTPDDFSVLLADGTGRQGTFPRLSVQVEANSETSFDVWASGSWDGQGTGRGFTLASAIQ
jgi:hypothetical protein